MHHERIAIIDFGSQYTRVIARRLRELGVFGLVYNSSALASDIQGADLKGIILSGGPRSVFDAEAPALDPQILSMGIPILGICYGQQILTKTLKGTLHRSQSREYGRAKIMVHAAESSVLFKGLKKEMNVWMSHGDHVEVAPPDFLVTAKTESVPVAAMESASQKIFAIQFHPEVSHTENGSTILGNFINFCQMKKDWSADHFIQEKIQTLRIQVGSGEVILGLSGGVDSSVAALLMHQAIGKQLHCIFIDTGLLRKKEREEVQESFAAFPLDITWVDAGEEFLTNLEGEGDPETKRKIIGSTFIDVFHREALKFKAQFLVQGTTYPDVIESSGIGGAVLVKSHHNVGGLPERLNLGIVEPLRELFKDEVRRVGLTLGLPKHLVYRHPFPGPGLGVRILGPLSEEKIHILQNADHIFIQELKSSGWYEKSSQAFAVLIPLKTVGIMGDERTYEYICALRSVSSEDYMTADWSRLPSELLERIAQRIVNEVSGINRVVYDITSKPPATIEWE